MVNDFYKIFIRLLPDGTYRLKKDLYVCVNENKLHFGNCAKAATLAQKEDAEVIFVDTPDTLYRNYYADDCDLDKNISVINSNILNG